MLALCFSRATETYHHWRVFSPGPAGVCIWFGEDELKRAVSKVTGVRIKPMEYLTVKDIRRKNVTVSRLPFVKQYAFKPENDVRMLLESETESISSLPIPFSFSAIAKIKLSPWLDPLLVKSLKALLKSITECRGYRIYRSTLVGNAEWKKRGREAA